MFKTIGAKVLAAAVALSVAPIAVPSSVPVIGISKAEAQYYGEGRHWRGDSYYRGGPGYYGDRPYYRHRNNNAGAAIAAGVIGLGLGAAIASASQPRYVYRDSPRYVYRDAPVYYRDAPRYYRPAPRVAYSGGRYEPWSRSWYNYCSARYRSFDGRSGTFQPYHGPRQFCR